MKFKIGEKDPDDRYARLFADPVVEAVNNLMLPRYGLGNYEKPSPHKPPTPDEAKVLADLSRAGTRLKGFCRTNLFKRLESSGYSFILSVERHILRNFICLHAIEKGLPVPIGTQDMGLLDTSANDKDTVIVNYDLPWAIIRLIQRAGRVDRIGQKSDTIVCYSFLPADGVERIIRLRSRVRQRLEENAEVVGADETFFEDQDPARAVRDLFTEKAGILDGDDDTEVD